MKFNISIFTPCSDGIIFYDSCTSFRNMWETCPRGDWLLWVSKKLNVNNRVLTLAKGRCAETALHFMQDERSKKAVQAAIDYGNGLISDKQLRDAYADAAAAYAVAQAAYDAATYNTVHKSYAVAQAADAAAQAATDDDVDHAAAAAAALAVAHAAFADAAFAAACDAYTAALKENQLLTANICREVLTNEVFRVLNGREDDKDEQEVK